MLNLNYQSLQAAGEHHFETVIMTHLHVILVSCPVTLFFQFTSLQSTDKSTNISALNDTQFCYVQV